MDAYFLESQSKEYACEERLRVRDQIFDAGALGNFSLAGFEMVR